MGFGLKDFASMATLGIAAPYIGKAAGDGGDGGKGAQALLSQGLSEVKSAGSAERDRLLQILEQMQGAQPGQADLLSSLGIISPFSTAGTQGFGQQLFGQDITASAGTELAQLNASPEAVLNDPLYQAQLAAGVGAAESGAAARGTQLSGGQLAALQKVGSRTLADTLQQRTQSLRGQADIGALLTQGGIGSMQATTGLQDVISRQQLGTTAGIADIYGSMASLSASQAQAKAQQQSGMFGVLGGLAGAAIGAGGGPVGMAAGYSIGSSIGGGM